MFDPNPNKLNLCFFIRKMFNKCIGHVYVLYLYMTSTNVFRMCANKKRTLLFTNKQAIECLNCHQKIGKRIYSYKDETLTGSS